MYYGSEGLHTICTLQNSYQLRKITEWLYWYLIFTVGIHRRDVTNRRHDTGDFKLKIKMVIFFQQIFIYCRNKIFCGNSTPVDPSEHHRIVFQNVQFSCLKTVHQIKIPENRWTPSKTTDSLSVIFSDNSEHLAFIHSNQEFMGMLVYSDVTSKEVGIKLLGNDLVSIKTMKFSNSHYHLLTFFKFICIGIWMD